MGYIDELNGFERWCETHSLPTGSQLLWYKLIALRNRAGWPEWVQVDNQRLMLAVGTKREATFINWRDKLIEFGLLEYQKGKKGYPNKYRMKSLADINTFNSEVNSVVNGVVNSEVNRVVNRVDIIRERERLEKEKDKALFVDDATNKKAQNDSTAKKIKYAEFVTMTNAEHDKLVSTHGPEETAELIDILDNYKGATGRVYKSDYRAILSWVVDRLESDRAKAAKRVGAKPLANRSFGDGNKRNLNALVVEE